MNSYQSTNPTAKARALQAMKKKKMYEQQRDQLLGTQFNVENLAFQQEQAEITAMTVKAMADGHKTLKDKTNQVDIGSVDKLMDDMAELQDEMNAMNEALAQGTTVDGATEDELAAEFAKLEEEAAAMTLAGGLPSVEPAGELRIGDPDRSARCAGVAAEPAAASTEKVPGGGYAEAAAVPSAPP
eukprot:Skav202631  [mRNA]  locus=scaffold1259:8558:25246:+ [translate_table: standard]